MNAITNGLLASLAISGFAFAGPDVVTGPDGLTFIPGEPGDHVRIADEPTCPDFVCTPVPDTTATDSGQAVGGAFGFNQYQGFTLDRDYTICEIGVDGWEFGGEPSTFQVQIYPDDGSGNAADLSSPLLSTPAVIDLEDAFVVDWFYDVLDTPITLTGGTKYYCGTIFSGDHASAIFRTTGNECWASTSYGIRNDGARFDTSTLCFRLTEGDSAGLTLTRDGACPGDQRVTVEGATANGNVALLFAAAPGNFVIPGGFTCAGSA